MVRWRLKRPPAGTVCFDQQGHFALIGQRKNFVQEFFIQSGCTLVSLNWPGK